MTTAPSQPAPFVKRIPNRRGWSLVETLVVVTLTSLLLGLMATFMQGILRINGTLKRDLELRTAINRLDRQFRSDARAAMEYSMEARPTDESTTDDRRPIETDSLRLQMSDQRQIAYRSLAGRVQREVTLNEKRTDVDAFRLPPGLRVAWRADRQGSRPLIQLIIGDQRNEAVSQGTGASPHVITAHIGADQRFHMLVPLGGLK